MASGHRWCWASPPAPRKPRASGPGSSARSPIAACPSRAPARARFADRIEHLLTLDGVGLVIADDHKGLRAAARRAFSAGLQRCRVHWARNLLGHAAPKQRAAVGAMIRTILAQDTKAEAFAQGDKVADALRDRHDRLGALMDASREDVLTYMGYPKEDRAQIASTKPLERVNKEIERRADVVGIFPNDEAVIRLVGALMLGQSGEWAVSRRYLSLESLARPNDTEPIQLPAVAA